MGAERLAPAAAISLKGVTWTVVVPLTDEAIEGVIRHSVKFGPSPYNSQGGRVLLLLGGHHDKFWNTALNVYRSSLPEEAFLNLEDKMRSFLSGYGTVLFFEDQKTVRDLQTGHPYSADVFPGWSLQASGMLQYSVWISLEEKGLGASLQHYNLAEDKVRELWDIPREWKLISQMPFGSITKGPDEKTFLPLEERIKVFK
jgi:predicted oxidoreductase (fatty acid repression mutant protein)